MPDHKDTVAIITGGSQGLGFAIAQRLIAEGCQRLVIAGRSVTKGEAAAKRLREAGADVQFLRADMGRVKDAMTMVDHAIARFGQVNALVNAAAATDRGSILDSTPEAWENLMGVNARGPFFAIQRFAQAAIAAGHPASAVNILSMTAPCGGIASASTASTVAGWTPPARMKPSANTMAHRKTGLRQPRPRNRWGCWSSPAMSRDWSAIFCRQTRA